jgi:hypothetical protein
MISLATRWMRPPAHNAPSQSRLSTTCRSSAIIRSSFSRTALKETSLTRLRMSRVVFGAGAFNGIDLNEEIPSGRRQKVDVAVSDRLGEIALGVICVEIREQFAVLA